MRRLLLPILVLILVSCNQGNKSNEAEIDMPFDTDSTPYVSSIEDYRKHLSQSRKEGYLQLVGLIKMDKEVMTFGKHDTNDLVLKIDRLPDTLGTFTKGDSDASFTASGGTEIKHDGDLIEKEMLLPLDEYGSSVMLHHNDLRWQIITRNDHNYLRIWDSKNPEIDAFKGFEYFPLNKDMLLEADFNYFENTKSEMVDSQLGPKASTEFVGQLQFKFEGKTYSLDVGPNGFTMVADQTTGDETYGGGRYLYLDLPEKNAKVILDFNKLYNPPCSFNEFTTCLYPPRQNELPFRILAGETIKRLP